MGLQADSAFGSNFERRFEPDDFYESFQAPKFHDFTAPEEPIDPDAFFMAQPGMVAKKAVVMEDVKTMAPKTLKVTAQDFPKTAQAGVQEVPPKVPFFCRESSLVFQEPLLFLAAPCYVQSQNARQLISLLYMLVSWTSQGVLRGHYSPVCYDS